MDIDNITNSEYSARLVKANSTEKEKHFEINFKLPPSASFNEVSVRMDEFLRSRPVKAALSALKGCIIHIRVLHPVDMHIRFQSI
jgi:hypothetical protein